MTEREAIRYLLQEPDSANETRAAIDFLLDPDLSEDDLIALAVFEEVVNPR